MANKKTVRRKDKDGNTIEYKYVEIKRDVGDGVSRSFTGKTKRDAAQKYESAKKKYIEQQITLDYEESTILFEDWAKYWLKTYVSVRDVSYDGTYAYPINNTITPYFKGMRLKDITESHLREFLNEINAYSKSRQEKILARLKAIFRTAHNNGKIRVNPSAELRLAKILDDIIKPKRWYNYDQARRVIDFAKSRPDGLCLMALLKSGMRRSELLAMPRVFKTELKGGVNTHEKMFCVRRSLSESSKGLSLNPCKTMKSRRDIPFDDEMAEALEKEPEIIYYKKTDKTYPIDYLIHGRYGKCVAPSNWSSRVYKKLKEEFSAYAASKKLDIELLNPHELRYSFGSVLYTRTKDIVNVSKLMGHSNIEITVRLYVQDDINVARSIIAEGGI